jgi:hypothetical protein
MRKNLKNLFNSDFKGDAVEQMLLAASVMDDWLWNPCKEEKVIHVDDLKDTWSQREKGKTEALAELEETVSAAKRAKVEQDNKAALSQEQKDRVLANRAKALAQKAAMEQARQERSCASASVSDFKKFLAGEKTTKAEDNSTQAENKTTEAEGPTTKLQETILDSILANRQEENPSSSFAAMDLSTGPAAETDDEKFKKMMAMGLG